MISEINSLIISSIRRDKEKGIAIATTKQETEVNSLSENVKNKLTSIFKGAGILVGDFLESEEKSVLPFEKSMEKFIDVDEEDNYFITDVEVFGEKASKLLAKKLSSGQGKIANDGFLVTYLYSEFPDEDDEDDEERKTYLCLIFLHRIEGTDIDEDELVF